MKRALSQKFFLQPTLRVAPALLGMRITTRGAGGQTSGMIVEVEAYTGRDDAASHSFRGPTTRNEVMFWPGGHCYVYLIYGMHHCVNVVTEPQNEGAAVLIRSVEPLEGLAEMKMRRGARRDIDLTSGPARLCEALGIDRTMSGEHFLSSDRIRLEPYKEFPPGSIARSTRIGITKSRELEWRFYIKDNPYVSRGRPVRP